MADISQVKEITTKLEQGVKDLFTSERYAEYLKTMSRFHKYSTRNTLLIHMQKPDATLVAGFQAWQNKWGRHVRKGEKSIKILAPVPFVKREEKEKLDPDTRLPIIGEDGMPVIEFTERQVARFKVTSVFDVSQTDGKPIPSLAQNLTGNVEQFRAFMDALRAVSPLPIVFEAMQDNQDGTCRFGVEIAIRAGMSEVQTVCAVIHEMTHAKLHDLSVTVDGEGGTKPKDRRTEEVEAESVSYAVSQYFGIDTGDNSFGYLAEWSRSRDLKELNASLDTIRKTAAELIDAIEGKFKEILQERDITLEADQAREGDSEPKTETPTAEDATIATALTANQVYAKYANIVAERAAQYAVSSGTLRYEDEAEARRACDQIVYRVVDDLLLAPGKHDSGEHYVLFNQYMSDPDFKARLEDYAFIRAYLEPRKALLEMQPAPEAPQAPPAPSKAKADPESKLYEKFAELFPQIASGEYSYLRLEAGDGFMPLSVECLSDSQISIMHTYTLNGDLCYDPMIVYHVGYAGEGDNEVKTLSAIEYEQSIPPLYQAKDDDGWWNSVDGNGNQKALWGLSESINEFTSQWFDNIGQQGYLPVRANLEIDGEMTRITFDDKGNPVMPEPSKEYSIGYGFFGNGITIWNQSEEKDGDYATVAHINPDRSVDFYDHDMPEDVMKGIWDVALSLDKQEFLYKSQHDTARQDEPLQENSEPETDVADGTDTDSGPPEPVQYLPDPSIGYSEMNLYGYDGCEVLPMTQSRAAELFDTGHTVYLLYPDNTESMVFDRDEIMNHDGIFGIDRTDWERTPEYAAMKAEDKNREGSREAELLHGSGNRFGIYQVRDGDDLCDYRFASIDEIQTRGLDVARENYELVYTAPFPQRIEFLTDRYPVLNMIYDEYNVSHPDDYTGRSVSVSDVVVLKYSGSISSHYIDSFGFVEIDYFLGEEKAQLPERQSQTIETSKNETYSQVGTRQDIRRAEAPKTKPTLMERLTENKKKAARQGQPEPHKPKEREVTV